MKPIKVVKAGYRGPTILKHLIQLINVTFLNRMNYNDYLCYNSYDFLFHLRKHICFLFAEDFQDINTRVLQGAWKLLWREHKREKKKLNILTEFGSKTSVS